MMDDEGQSEEGQAPGAGGAVEGETAEVFDPRHHGEGRSRYTSYCVLMRSSAADPSPGCSCESKSAVRRRYREFQWLSRRLHKERPGAIVPVLPHKSAITADARLSEEVVSFRRASCEVWINRILRHPELSNAPSLSLFLQADDDAFASAMKSGEVDVRDDGDETEECKSDERGGTQTSGKGGGERFRRIKKFATKVKVALARGSDLERSVDEPAFEEISDYISELESQVQLLLKHAAALTNSYKEQNVAMQAISTKFSAAGVLSYPNAPSNDSSHLSTLLTKIGDTTSALGLTEMNRHNELSEKLEVPIQDLAREVQSVRLALECRREIQVALTSWEQKVQFRTKELDHIRDNPHFVKHYEAHLAQTTKDLKEAEEAVAASRDRFVEVSSRLLREFERFRPEMSDRVLNVVSTWANVQIEYNSRAISGWGGVHVLFEF